MTDTDTLSEKYNQLRIDYVELMSKELDLEIEIERLRRLNNYLWEHRSSHWSADDDAEMDRLEMIE